jgi:hypothetical protein
MKVQLRVFCWLLAAGLILLANGAPSDKKAFGGLLAGLLLGIVIGSDWQTWCRKFPWLAP